MYISITLIYALFVLDAYPDYLFIHSRLIADNGVQFEKIFARGLVNQHQIQSMMYKKASDSFSNIEGTVKTTTFMRDLHIKFLIDHFSM